METRLQNLNFHQKHSSGNHKLLRLRIQTTAVYDTEASMGCRDSLKASQLLFVIKDGLDGSDRINTFEN